MTGNNEKQRSSKLRPSYVVNGNDPYNLTLFVQLPCIMQNNQSDGNGLTVLRQYIRQACAVNAYLKERDLYLDTISSHSSMKARVITYKVVAIASYITKHW